MNPLEFKRSMLTRRAFLANSGLSLGAMALADLSAAEGRASGFPAGDGAPLGPHHSPRARSVIYLHMSGSPPQLDMFDPKPRLQELHGSLCPKSFIEGKRLAFIKGHPTLLGSPFSFGRYGESGVEVSELVPHMGQIMDRATLIRTMHTDQFNHGPAELRLFTGDRNVGAAAMGAWASWGLGTENRDLPAFVVLTSGGTDPSAGKSVWGSGFLPSATQGVRLRGSGEPILYVSDPKGMDRNLRRRTLDALAALNLRRAEQQGDPETEARISQYELAFRMQASVPELMDIGQEPADVHELYGSQPGQASFANNCLLARRLVESGVRWVQLYDWGWDTHGTGTGDDLLTALPKKCRETDRAAAALVLDLDRRGLLDETLVVWGGEFGRTAMNEARNGSTYWGRDHHPDCFSLWMAGAGVHRGRVVGETDELGYTIAEGAISVHDLQDTIMHLMGLDTRSMSYPYQGLDRRLVGAADHSSVQHHLFS
ncbi:MAG: sulfatase [Planctomycetes bacterium]|jgi:hypothetical protein|nr:sulfatase [Planctomycetota bacterium]HJM57652.1 DUF1501 domain-containing protein [Planctomycetota bacterium]